MPDAVSIFVLPPNPEILATRLRERSREEGSLLEEEIDRRLAKAKVRSRITVSTLYSG